MRFQGCLLCCGLTTIEETAPSEQCSHCGHPETVLYSDPMPTESEMLEVRECYLARLSHHPDTIGRLAKLCLHQNRTIEEQKEIIARMVEAELLRLE